MKAIVIHAANDLRLEERAPDALGGPGQVRVRVAAGGICGSDLHYFKDGGFGSVRLREPMILGHEVSGTISEVGQDVSGVAVGDLVAVSPSRPCGVCEHCTAGRPVHCLDMRFYGSAMPFPHIQGAFREDLVADVTQCVRADGLTPAAAALAEPLSVCLHAAHQAGDLLGARVLVTGCGPIGVLAIATARRAGAAEIIATDLSPAALEMALRMGADTPIDVSSTSDPFAAYKAGKGQIDVMFECSGTAAALRQAIPALRPRGTIIQVGIGGDMTLPMIALTAKELTLKGTFRFHEEFATAIRLMQSGLIDLAPVITHTFALTDAVPAFLTACDRNQAMKVQIAF
jgi:L-idonate 5-dehydrogenase